MARILFSPSNTRFEGGQYHVAGVYDQIVSELVRLGNDVKVFVPNIFLKQLFFSQNELNEHVDEERLREDIRDFNPDLVITFNNKIYDKILDVVDCKVAVWGADLEFYWNQVDYIKQNVGRYFFFCFSDHEMKDRKKFFKCSANQIFNIRSATMLKAEKTQLRSNISFIGTFFDSSPKITSLVTQYRGGKDIKTFFKTMREKPGLSQAELVKELDKRVEDVGFVTDVEKLDKQALALTFSREDRVLALASVADLGLDLYGDPGWEGFAGFLPSLSACKKKRTVYSKEENARIYNSSKICININHGQTVMGMPYRVCDIMATSGCLVSSYSPFIEKCFKNVPIPFFDYPTEARAVCKALLSDENRRADIVAACNEAINGDWRWEQRFREIEQATGVSLFPKKKDGELSFLTPWQKAAKAAAPAAPVAPVVPKGKMPLRYRCYYKVWKHLNKKLKKRRFI